MINRHPYRNSRWRVTGLALVLAALTINTGFAQTGPENTLSPRAQQILQQLRTQVQLAQEPAAPHSLGTCVALSTNLGASLGGDVKAGLRVVGKAEPGVALVRALVKGVVKLNVQASAGIGASGGGRVRLCVDWLALADQLIASAQNDNPSALESQLTEPSQAFIRALAQTNPASVFNTMLARSDDFGFDPQRLSDSAMDLDTNRLNYLTTPPAVGDVVNLLGETESLLADMTGAIPFAGQLNTQISGLFTDADSLNPCRHRAAGSRAASINAVLDQVCGGIQSFGSQVVSAIGQLNALLDLESARSLVAQVDADMGIVLARVSRTAQSVRTIGQSTESIRTRAIRPVCARLRFLCN